MVHRFLLLKLGFGSCSCASGEWAAVMLHVVCLCAGYEAGDGGYHHTRARLLVAMCAFACEARWGLHDPAEGAALGSRLGRLLPAKLAAPPGLNMLAGGLEQATLSLLTLIQAMQLVIRKPCLHVRSVFHHMLSETVNIAPVHSAFLGWCWSSGGMVPGLVAWFVLMGDVAPAMSVVWFCQTPLGCCLAPVVRGANGSWVFAGIWPGLEGVDAACMDVAHVAAD
jgi:hypothetical protein